VVRDGVQSGIYVPASHPRRQPLNIYRRYSSITNKIQRYTMVLITINALHVSGVSSAHHQELKTVYTASGICRAFSASYRYHELEL